MKLFISITLFLLAISISSCKKSDKTLAKGDLVCGVKDPIKNLPWLNKEYQSLAPYPEVNAIVLYQFNDKYVIEIQAAIFSSTNSHQYYCDGNKLDLTEPTSFNSFRQNRREVKVLFGTKIWN